MGFTKLKNAALCTCIPVADSFWCLAKLIQCFRFKNKKKKKKEVVHGSKKKKKERKTLSRDWEDKS